MGGGILPMALYKGKRYFLFSRETLDGEDDPGKWSDFGGSKQKHETPFATAIREGWEESSGFLGNKTSIRNLVKNHKVARIKSRTYTTYIVKIGYDNNLPKEFQKDYRDIKKHNPDLIYKHNGLYEKDKLMWMPFDKLKSNLRRFRPWYREIVKLIINEFE